MAKSNVSEPAIAAQPIFLTNISNFPVENIMLTVDREYGSASNVQVSVEPSTAFDLQKGQAMSKLAFAKATANISEPVRAKIIITGRLGQLNNRAGANDSYDYYTQYYEGEQSLQSYYPKTTNTQYYTNTDQTLGMIDVIIFYSGFNCLKVNPIDSMEYNMTNLGQI